MHGQSQDANTAAQLPVDEHPAVDTTPAVRKNLTRRAVLGLGIGAGSLALAACSASGSTSSAAKPGTSKGGGSGSGSPVNLVWWNMWSGTNADINKKMIDEFNQSQSKIQVTLLNVPSANGDAKLLSAIAAGNPPDVFTEWNPTLGEYAATGAIMAMDEYMTGKYKGIASWMYPSVLHAGQYQGKTYAIPMSMNSYALYYNKQLLKKAGISKLPTTLDELDSVQARTWTVSGNRVSQIGFYPLGGSIAQYSPYFGVTGCGFENGKYNLSAQPAAAKEAAWLQSYNKYPNSGVTALTNALGSVAGGSNDAFAMGKNAFALNGVWEAATNIPSSNPAMVDNFGVIPLPNSAGVSGKPGTYVNGNYNVIPKGSKHPEEAFEFIAWLSGYDHPGQAKYAPQGGWMPPSPELAKAPDYVTWIKKAPYVQTFIDLFLSETSQAVPLTKAESEYTTASTTAVDNIATRKWTGTQALQYIDKQANAALSKK